MIRVKIQPRVDYAKKIESLGFQFNRDYWLENAYYSFSAVEIAQIEDATKECYSMYCSAVEYVIQHNLWGKLAIPEYIVPSLIESWERDDLSIYGRFDFALEGGAPKLLEFNADTPTSLFEASIVQWEWKEELFPDNDQFNSIHEALVQSWRDINREYSIDRMHFTGVLDSVEDLSTIAYIADTATEAGIDTSIFGIDQLKLDSDRGVFLTPCEQDELRFLFKLYPFEWMFREEFGIEIPRCNTRFIEPLWKAIMSNKYMLVIIAELFPNSEYILRAWNEKKEYVTSYCKKPIFSREGANVTLVKHNEIIEQTEGEYGEEGFIYQALANIRSQDGMFPIIGSWVIGGESCGIGIRETNTRITDNMSYFVPHIIE